MKPRYLRRPPGGLELDGADVVVVVVVAQANLKASLVSRPLWAKRTSWPRDCSLVSVGRHQSSKLAHVERKICLAPLVPRFQGGRQDSPSRLPTALNGMVARRWGKSATCKTNTTTSMQTLARTETPATSARPID